MDKGVDIGDVFSIKKHLSDTDITTIKGFARRLMTSPNCVKVAVSVAKFLETGDIIYPYSSLSPTTLANMREKNELISIVKHNYRRISYIKNISFADLLSLLTQAGKGSHCITSAETNSMMFSFGHAFNILNDNNKIRCIDAQTISKFNSSLQESVDYIKRFKETIIEAIIIYPNNVNLQLLQWR